MLKNSIQYVQKMYSRNINIVCTKDVYVQMAIQKFPKRTEFFAWQKSHTVCSNGKTILQYVQKMYSRNINTECTKDVYEQEQTTIHYVPKKTTSVMTIEIFLSTTRRRRRRRRSGGVA